MILQKWIGFIQEVKPDVVVANLRPLIGEGSEQWAEIYREYIEWEPLVGDIFERTITDEPNSTIERKDTGRWTKEDIERAKREAERLSELFNE